MGVLEHHTSQVPWPQLMEECALSCLAAACAGLAAADVLRAYRQVGLLLLKRGLLHAACRSVLQVVLRWVSSPWLWWAEHPSIIYLTMALQVCVNAIAVVPAAHRGPEDWLGLALYPRAAMLNHACEPNVAASFVGHELRLHALTALAPSAILRLSYGPQVQPYQPLLAGRYTWSSIYVWRLLCTAPGHLACKEISMHHSYHAALDMSANAWEAEVRVSDAHRWERPSQQCGSATCSSSTTSSAPARAAAKGRAPRRMRSWWACDARPAAGPSCPARAARQGCAPCRRCPLGSLVPGDAFSRSLLAAPLLS